MGDESDDIKPDLQPLFRPEVLQTHSRQYLGAIRLTQPIAGWLLTTVATAFGVALILYAVLGTITKKVRVTGITVPVGGSISIATRTGGLLSKILVEDGDRVSQGQALFEISTARQGELGELTGLVATQLTNRSENLSTERRLRQALAIEKGDALKRRIFNISSSIAQLNVEIGLVKKRENLAQASVARFQTLQRDGFVSGAQTQQKQEELIDIEARISNMRQAKLQLMADAASAQSDLSALSTSHAVELAQLDSTSASLRQEITENQGRKLNLIVANEAGIITTLTTRSGQEVSPGQTLTTLTPVKNFRNFEVLLLPQAELQDSSALASKC
ncbi:HlyD family secretion protein [Massilia sp. B-10]|nr:HlyD family secretion protein [Massilia sp. B-10]